MSAWELSHWMAQLTDRHCVENHSMISEYWQCYIMSMIGAYFQPLCSHNLPLYAQYHTLLSTLDAYTAILPLKMDLDGSVFLCENPVLHQFGSWWFQVVTMTQINIIWDFHGEIQTQPSPFLWGSFPVISVSGISTVNEVLSVLCIYTKLDHDIHTFPSQSNWLIPMYPQSIRLYGSTLQCCWSGGVALLFITHGQASSVNLGLLVSSTTTYPSVDINLCEYVTIT